MTADGHHLHEVVAGDGVEFAPAVAGIDEGTQPDAGQRARLAGRDVAVQMGDNALR